MRPQQIRNLFYLGQIGLGVLFLILGWLFLKPKDSESGFKVREADRPATPPKSRQPHDDRLANARIKRSAPLSLPGIRIDGSPYEILGVNSRSSVSEIQRAYRELMKRYHPDKVGRPGSREWQDAQKIAEAINQAKESLLKGKT